MEEATEPGRLLNVRSLWLGNAIGPPTLTEKKLNQKIVLRLGNNTALGSKRSNSRERMEFAEGGFGMANIEMRKQGLTCPSIDSVSRKRQVDAENELA